MGADALERLTDATITISIHGPRVGADFLAMDQGDTTYKNFNPRPTCGGRPERVRAEYDYLIFQSTAPVWGPTQCVSEAVGAALFQSTAPVWGPTLTVR